MVYVVLILLGLCFGSFINALVWRLHEQSLPKKKRVASDADLSISKGRSMCPHCQHTLGALDLLPLVSWLSLRGKCRYCKHPISWQYPIVEATLAILLVVSYILWPQALQGLELFRFGVWLLALIGLLALIVYDLRWMLLPNKIVFPLIALGLLQTAVFTIYNTDAGYLLHATAAVGIAGGIYYVLFQISKGTWIGGGDVKLGFALGLLVETPAKAFLVLFLASLIGLLIALPGLLHKRLSTTSKVPFGPSLIVATVVVVLIGQQVVDWYSSALLI
jgi:prepilin signal peptidase PulO-like enzyme (type II secretory pathway)